MTSGVVEVFDVRTNNLLLFPATNVRPAPDVVEVYDVRSGSIAAFDQPATEQAGPSSKIVEVYDPSRDSIVSLPPASPDSPTNSEPRRHRRHTAPVVEVYDVHADVVIGLPPPDASASPSTSPVERRRAYSAMPASPDVSEVYDLRSDVVLSVPRRPLAPAAHGARSDAAERVVEVYDLRSDTINSSFDDAMQVSSPASDYGSGSGESLIAEVYDVAHDAIVSVSGSAVLSPNGRPLRPETPESVHEFYDVANNIVVSLPTRRPPSRRRSDPSRGQRSSDSALPVSCARLEPLPRSDSGDSWSSGERFASPVSQRRYSTSAVEPTTAVRVPRLATSRIPTSGAGAAINELRSPRGHLAPLYHCVDFSAVSFAHHRSLSDLGVAAAPPVPAERLRESPLSPRRPTSTPLPPLSDTTPAVRSPDRRPVLHVPEKPPRRLNSEISAELLTKTPGARTIVHSKSVPRMGMSSVRSGIHGMAVVPPRDMVASRSEQGVAHDREPTKQPAAERDFPLIGDGQKRPVLK
eukprot:TRINITY_DN22660_c0_g1_i1.p1 TRINITY_DN22660_c0_g1~~TRINITY_DN22660_c0_g1_i1.p1  ORF type:complete len:522 (-),score=139.33 TRINITY_DN22660_c0_g1_i1:102-1667(-)